MGTEVGIGLAPRNDRLNPTMHVAELFREVAISRVSERKLATSAVSISAVIKRSFVLIQANS